MRGTYSAEDNKLRLYADGRLDAETYAEVKAAGFQWAPKQELFVAPSWSPAREDLLLELCEEIEDEDYSATERAADVQSEHRRPRGIGLEAELHLVAVAERLDRRDDRPDGGLGHAAQVAQHFADLALLLGQLRLVSEVLEAASAAHAALEVRARRLDAERR